LVKLVHHRCIPSFFPPPMSFQWSCRETPYDLALYLPTNIPRRYVLAPQISCSCCCSSERFCRLSGMSLGRPHHNFFLILFLKKLEKYDLR
jgi:hypothetical protein